MEDQMDVIIEKGLKYDLDPNEIGVAFAVMLWYAAAWADGQVQEAEEALIEDLKMGAGLIVSDKGKLYLDEVAEYFRTQSPSDDAVDMILDIIEENDDMPHQIKVISAANLFGIANAHGSLFSKICRDEKVFLEKVCQKLNVDYDEAKKIGESFS